MQTQVLREEDEAGEDLGVIKEEQKKCQTLARAGRRIKTWQIIQTQTCL